MRNVFDGSRRGRRPGRAGLVLSSSIDSSSPYDFGARDEDSADPVDLMAIRADDELLDALVSGVSLGDYDPQRGGGLDPGFQDDQRMLALLSAWRGDVLDEPIPDLLTVEEASEAIVAGERAATPRRRLMPVAAAAAAVVVGMSAVAIGAGSAQPGDPLWGVSKTLNSERAASVEATQRVSVALASVQRALAEGRVAEAKATLASISPELTKVSDEDTRQELARKEANLVVAASEAKEGEKVHTDSGGKRDKDSERRGSSERGAKSNGPGPAGADSRGSGGAAAGGPGSSGKGSTSTGSPGSAPYDPKMALTSARPVPPDDSAGAPHHGPGTPPHSDPPKQDPPKSDPPRSDPPKSDPPAADPSKGGQPNSEATKDDPKSGKSGKDDPTKSNKGDQEHADDTAKGGHEGDQAGGTPAGQGSANSGQQQGGTG